VVHTGKRLWIIIGRFSETKYKKKRREMEVIDLLKKNQILNEEDV